HMRYSWRILNDERGRPTRLFGAAQDITEIRSAEETIRLDRARLRDIVECSSDSIWETDTQGALRIFSGTAQQLLEDVIAEARLVAVDDVNDADIEILRKAFANREKFRNLLLPLATAKGEVRWYRLSG